MPAQLPDSPCKVSIPAYESGKKASAAKWWLSAWVVLPFLFAVIMVSRIPSISWNIELNMDESQMMAQAMRVEIDPIPWRGMDGTTSGPMNSWALFIIHKLGVPFQYSYIHAFAAVLLSLLATLTYATLRQIGSKYLALFGGSLTAIVFALAQDVDFIHYSSELISAVLLSAAIFFIALRYRYPDRSLVLDCLTGLLLGIVPWAKLQACVGAGLLALWLGWQIICCQENGAKSSRNRFRHLLLFSISFLLPAILIIGTVACAGAFDDFWGSYVKTNLAYSALKNETSLWRRVVILLKGDRAGRLIQAMGLFVLAWSVSKLSGWRSADHGARKLLQASTVLAIGNAVAVLKPPFHFVHYEILLFHPLTLLSGCILCVWKNNFQGNSGRKLPFLLLTLCFLTTHITILSPAFMFAKYFWDKRETKLNATSEKIVNAVGLLSPPVKSLVVWGWMPSVYVGRNVAPATRHAICHFLIDAGPAQARLRAGFLSDIRRERPELIIDAVADGCFRWYWDMTKGLESFPEFSDYVHANYILASTIVMGSPNAPIRFFLSREYLASRDKTVTP